MSEPILDNRRPAFAFRVGITGARKLPRAGSQDRDRIEAQARAVLANLQVQLAAALADPHARACYDADRPARMVCLSPLADGADRVFAEAAVTLTQPITGNPIAVELRVTLPFNSLSYKNTFGGVDGLDNAQSVAAFDALVARAAGPPLVIDGDASERNIRRESYEAVGRLVARNCDLLVAIWDRDEANAGRGGTADIVRFALHAGIPVWRIDALGQLPPALWTSPRDLNKSAAPEAAPAALHEIVRTIMIPTTPARAEQSRFGEPMFDPLAAYFAEELKANRNIWLWHSGVIGTLRRIAARKPSQQDSDLGYAPQKQKWRNSHLIQSIWSPYGREPLSGRRTIPAQMAGWYQFRYRTSYLFIFFMGAIALIVAVMGVSGVVGWTAKKNGISDTLGEFYAGLIEFAALFIIAVLVLANRRFGWHRRYLDYRLLSELVRPALYLAPLGWNLPFHRMNKAADAHKGSWVPWLAAAYVRATPLAHGQLADAIPSEKLRVAKGMIGGQIDYHVRRKLECGGANDLFGCIGATLFAITIACVILKLVMPMDAECQLQWLPCRQPFGWTVKALMPYLGCATALIPALSAAAFGIKAYEEFEMLSETSEKMVEDLAIVRNRVEQINPSHPLASQILAEDGLDAALIMLSEAASWAQMLRAKAIEAA